MIAVIDYGVGNLGSLHRMLKHVGAESVKTKDIETIKKANGILLPGVGAFSRAMINLRAAGLEEILIDRAKADRVPFLGVCLGMQMLTSRSEEYGNETGLNLIPGHTAKFVRQSNSEERFRIPHMGWNDVVPIEKENPGILRGMPEFRFYFAHSYHVVPDHSSSVMGQTHYGINFVSAIRQDNIYGVQFHPEKSHRYGMQLMKNFLEEVYRA